jgi:hypothetical protein
MPGRIRSRLTYANVMSTIAVVFALGGGVAYAANTVFSTDIVDGEVKNADLAPNSVATSKISNGTVGLADLAPDAVDASKVLDESLTAFDLGSNSVGSDEIQTDAVNATEIADNTIDGGEIIDNSMTSTDLAADSVGNSELTDNAVSGANVTNNSLTTADLLGAESNGSISLSGIANGRCTQVTFNVGSAQVGQVPLVATGAAMQNGIVLIAQRVASAGHVEVDACNFSGGAMTAISGFPVRVLTFG